MSEPPPVSDAAHPMDDGVPAPLAPDGSRLSQDDDDAAQLFMDSDDDDVGNEADLDAEEPDDGNEHVQQLHKELDDDGHDTHGAHTGADVILDDGMQTPGTPGGLQTPVPLGPSGSETPLHPPVGAPTTPQQTALSPGQPLAVPSHEQPLASSSDGQLPTTMGSPPLEPGTPVPKGYYVDDSGSLIHVHERGPTWPECIPFPSVSYTHLTLPTNREV